MPCSTACRSAMPLCPGASRRKQAWPLTLGFSLFTLLLLGCLPLFSSLAAHPPPVFKAGAATSNITPWLGVSINGNMRDKPAQHIHDELHARALVLDDGRTRLAIVLCDSCMIPRAIFDDAKHMVQERTGLPLDHMLMAATHTHSAPAATGIFQSEPDPRYQQFLTRRIADSVQRAVNNLQPARIGWGVGKLDTQVFNRRWKLKGKMPPGPFKETHDKVKMNPRPGSPELVEPAGPIDPQVSVVAVQTAGGEPLALLANYSLHYVGGTRGGEVSADYFGMFADRIQQMIGADRRDPPFVAMLSNGTSGDINNINFRKPRERREPYEQMRIVAGELAREVERVYLGLEYHDWVPLDARVTELEFAVRKANEAEFAWARQVLKDAGSGQLTTLPQIYARETALLSQYPDKVRLIVQSLRIGDLAIAAIPCEVFAEIGLELREKSPFGATFTIELAGGYNGYLPTPRQHELGGYETWRARSSYLEKNASVKIVETLVKQFKALKE